MFCCCWGSASAGTFTKDSGGSSIQDQLGGMGELKLKSLAYNPVHCEVTCCIIVVQVQRSGPLHLDALDICLSGTFMIKNGLFNVAFTFS